MSRAHKDKGNRGEREWRDFLKTHGFRAWRPRDGRVDVQSNVKGVHWEVKRVEDISRMPKWVKQADKDGAAYGKAPIVAFRRNFEHWRCIVPAEFLMELLKIKAEWEKRERS